MSDWRPLPENYEIVLSSYVLTLSMVTIDCIVQDWRMCNVITTINIIITIIYLLTVSTKAKVASCQGCGKNFYTYIPDTNCLMPDGSSLFYQEPQLLCPLCDDHEFGWWYNVDLFPEFKARVRPYWTIKVLDMPPWQLHSSHNILFNY